MNNQNQTQSQHTPGPWSVNWGDARTMTKITADGVVTAQVTGDAARKDAGTFSDPKTNANARLIAESPELYRLGKLLLERYEFRHEWNAADEREVFILLNGAIARVEGRA